MDVLSNLPIKEAESFLDYIVVDPENKLLGSLHSLWSNSKDGRPEFLGIKTGWLIRPNHIVPAVDAQLDESGGVILVRYTLDQINGSPTLRAGAEMSDEMEAAILGYYNQSGFLSNEAKHLARN